jgi:thiamine transport system substrate-binding protein
MGIVKSTDNPRLAREFLNYVLTTEVQEKIPHNEFVFPANPNALLPVKFTQLAVVPPKPVILPLELVAENDDRWLEDWAKLVVTGK